LKVKRKATSVPQAEKASKSSFKSSTSPFSLDTLFTPTSSDPLYDVQFTFAPPMDLEQTADVNSAVDFAEDEHEWAPDNPSGIYWKLTSVPILIVKIMFENKLLIYS